MRSTKKKRQQSFHRGVVASCFLSQKEWKYIEIERHKGKSEKFSYEENTREIHKTKVTKKNRTRNTRINKN